MNRALQSLLFILVPVMTAAQELPRSNENTDLSERRFYTVTEGPAGSGKERVFKPSDMTEPTVGGTNGMGVSQIHPEPWPAGVDFVEGKSLPVDISVPAYDRDDSWTANGRRVLALEVKPGEKLVFNLKGEDAQVVMRTYLPVPPPTLKWKLELVNANRPIRSRRAKHLELQNPSSETQMLFLILYGVSGNAYRVDLVRTPSKKS